ncbi:MAG: Wzz/FepE/Etk N-terminal domain-containing protein [Candidatus Scalindua sp.]
MNEYPINLMNCFVVIWKRKLLIMLGTLVCLVAGGVVSLRLTETYRAENLIRIGKTSETPIFMNTFNKALSLVPLDSTKNLIITIPVEYNKMNQGEAIEFSLRVEEVKGTYLIKVILEATDRRRAGEMLKDVVGRLLADHHRRAEVSIQPYKAHIGMLEKYIKKIQKDRDGWEVALEELKKEINREMNIEGPDYIASIMVQNRNLEINKILGNSLKESSANMAKIKQEISMYRFLIDSLDGYKTRVIGEVKETTVKPKRKRNVMLAGVVGLTMSLFLAFSLEYLGKVSEGEKKKKESNSVFG